MPGTTHHLHRHITPRMMAIIWGVRINYSTARAVFGQSLILGEYTPEGPDHGPLITLYAEGIDAWVLHTGDPRASVVSRALMHELLHHAAGG